MTQEAPGAGKAKPRIALRSREEMTPEQRAAFDADPMARVNIARLLSIAETLWPPMQATNHAMATAITVPQLDRELVTLATVHLERGQYQMTQHLEVARMMGMSAQKVAAIAEERYGDPILTDRERALLAFTRQVVKAVRVDDATFSAVAAFYDARQILELTFVIGNYMTLARMTEVAELEVDGAQGASFWKDKLAD